MIEQVLLILMLNCGQPYMGIMWGGEVEPQRFRVEALPDGRILVPNENAEDFSYIVTHPDLEVERWETVNPQDAPFVCGKGHGA